MAIRRKVKNIGKSYEGKPQFTVMWWAGIPISSRYHVAMTWDGEAAAPLLALDAAMTWEGEVAAPLLALDAAMTWEGEAVAPLLALDAAMTWDGEAAAPLLAQNPQRLRLTLGPQPSLKFVKMTIGLFWPGKG